jgi:1-phosphatidylinositol-4-phosphate 5-kinase
LEQLTNSSGSNASQQTASRQVHPTAHNASAKPPPAEVVFLLNNVTPFRDFRPETFHKMRQLCDVNEDRYLELISQPAHEKLSEGKSGAFFFLCGEGEIIVKTIERHEASTLLSILDEYFTHIMKNPTSLLVRFLGLHSIKLYGNEFYVVVMKNIFPSGLLLNERYDIKGSWIQRNATLSTPGKLSTCRYCGERFIEGSNDMCTEVVGTHEASVTLKDNDLITKIRLYPEDAFQIIESLYSDSDALCSMGVMDYSLLVGVHFARYDVDTLHRMQHPINEEFFPPTCHDGLPEVDMFLPSSNLTSATTSPLKGLPNTSKTSSTTGYPARVVIAPKEYYFGIVDVLQTWSWSKKMERWFKVYILGQSGKGISCMNPQDFKDRYQRKIGRIIEHANIVREVTGSWQGKRDVGNAFHLVDQQA